MLAMAGMTPMEVIVVLVLVMLVFAKRMPPRPPTGAVPIEPDVR